MNQITVVGAVLLAIVALGSSHPNPAGKDVGGNLGGHSDLRGYTGFGSFRGFNANVEGKSNDGVGGRSVQLKSDEHGAHCRAGRGPPPPPPTTTTPAPTTTAATA